MSRLYKLNSSISTFIDLKSLNFEEAITLMIHLGCPKELEQRLLENNGNVNYFDGKFVFYIENREDLINECFLEMRNPIINRILDDLKDLKEKGISENLINKIRDQLQFK